MPENPALIVDFNHPITVGKEMEYMTEAIANAQISGDGPFTQKASGLLEQELNV